MKNAAPTTVTVTVHRTFKASQERVFNAWLDPEKARKFLFNHHEGAHGGQHVVRAEIDPRVGGKFLFVAHRAGKDGKESRESDHYGEYLEINRYSRLAFTLMCPCGWSETTKVTIDFTALSTGGCELTLTHEGLPTHLEGPIFEGWTEFMVALEKLQG